MDFDPLVEDSCTAWQADYFKIPENETSDEHGQKFCILFEVILFNPPVLPLEDEEDYILIVSKPKTSTTFRRFCFASKNVECNNLEWRDISLRLTQLGVPLHKQPVMLQRISACADQIVNAPNNRGKRVLSMRVTITLNKDYGSYGQGSSGALTLWAPERIAGLPAVPAISEVIERLEKVVIQEPRLIEKCSICRVEFRIGCEVRHLPCGHFCHENCIVCWLGVSKICPICLLELNATSI